MKKIAALAAVVLAVVLLLTACGDDLEGTWEISETIEGQTITATCKFDDGKLTIKEGGITIEGTYKTDGDKLTTTVNGQDTTSTYKVSGKTLTITDSDGQTTTYTKK